MAPRGRSQTPVQSCALRGRGQKIFVPEAGGEGLMEAMLPSIYTLVDSNHPPPPKIPSVGYNFHFHLKVLLGYRMIYFLSSQGTSLSKRMRQSRPDLHDSERYWGNTPAGGGLFLQPLIPSVRPSLGSDPPGVRSLVEDPPHPGTFGSWLWGTLTLPPGTLSPTVRQRLAPRSYSSPFKPSPPGALRLLLRSHCSRAQPH